MCYAGINGKAGQFNRTPQSQQQRQQQPFLSKRTAWGDTLTIYIGTNF